MLLYISIFNVKLGHILIYNAISSIGNIQAIAFYNWKELGLICE